MNSYLKRLLLSHLFPVGINDDICRFWRDIYRNCCFSIKNSCIGTSHSQMHNIGSGFIEFITNNWSITDWLICSINISIVPKVISRRNCFIGWVTTGPCIKSYCQWCRSRTRRKWGWCFDRIFILNCIGNSCERNFTVFVEWVEIFFVGRRCHRFGSLLTLFVNNLKSIFLWKIRKNLIHNCI